jgi:hypothetical protein
MKPDRRRTLALAAAALLHAWAAADTGALPLHRIHTGDLGVLVAIDVDTDGVRGRWLVDTGASQHLVAPAFARRHALRERSRLAAEAPFGRIEGPQVDLPPLRIGADTLPRQRALVLDLAQIAGPAAEGIDGVLGAPWLDDVALDLDLRAWTLRARRSDGDDCPPGLAALAVRRLRGLPVIELQVDAAAPERALLDTGNAGALVRIDGEGAPPRAGVPVPGAPAVAARAAQLRIGALVRGDVPVTYLVSPALRRALAADVGALAGMALFEGARLQLDLGRQRLCLEPGERRLPGGFGFTLQRDGLHWAVAGVFAGSPAALAGLRAGDRVLRWDDAPMPATSDAAWASVQGRDELTLLVERDGVPRPMALRRAYFLPLLQ